MKYLYHRNLVVKQQLLNCCLKKTTMMYNSERSSLLHLQESLLCVSSERMISTPLR